MRLGSSSRCAAASQHQTPGWHLHHTPPVAPAAHRQQQQHPAAPGSLCQHVCNLWTAPRAAAVLVRASNDASPFSAATTAATAGVVSSSSSTPATAGPNVNPTSSEPNQQQHSGSADSAVVGTNTWEEEIEETLKLVQLLPPSVRGVLEGHSRLYEVLEVVMDLGRPPTARFPGRDEKLADSPVTQEDLDYAVTQVGDFGGDNRAGIDATLHRISCLRNRAGRIVGLTCRVGRAIHGSAGLVADLVSGGASVLFMGRPGVGKTTAIRELSRLLADDLQRRVVIVDTSNEIGGDGDVPHAGIGRARRMQVPDPEQQHRVMIEAVENHMPQVVVIDEIGTEAECSAARTIAQRGVQLVATAHGNELQNLVKNPALSDLIGGIQSVTLGDDEAKRRGVQKSILERAAPPTFDVAVEMLERSRWCVYSDVAAAVDSLLAGQHPGGEMRQRQPDGTITKYTFSRERQQQQQEQGDSVFGSRRGSSSGSSGSGRVLPDLPGSESGVGSSPSGGGFVRRLFVNEEQGRPGSPAVMRRGRSLQLGLSSPDGALLRLHASELDDERLWEVMSAMGLHDKVYIASRPSDADAVLAVRSKLRSNTGLRQAARQAGVPVYAIKSSSSSNLIRAFRTLLGQEPSAGGTLGAGGSLGGEGEGAEAAAAAAAAGGTSIDLGGSRSSGDETDGEDGEELAAGAAVAAAAVAAAAVTGSSPGKVGGAAQALQQEEDGLEEARLAAEQIVMPLQQPVELLPRPEFVRKAQAALCERYGLAWEVVGSRTEARLRVSPTTSKAAAAVAGAGAGAGEAAANAKEE